MPGQWFRMQSRVDAVHVYMAVWSLEAKFSLTAQVVLSHSRRASLKYNLFRTDHILMPGLMGWGDLDLVGMA